MRYQPCEYQKVKGGSELAGFNCIFAFAFPEDLWDKKFGITLTDLTFIGKNSPHPKKSVHNARCMAVIATQHCFALLVNMILVVMSKGAENEEEMNGIEDVNVNNASGVGGSTIPSNIAEGLEYEEGIDEARASFESLLPRRTINYTGEILTSPEVASTNSRSEEEELSNSDEDASSDEEGGTDDGTRRGNNSEDMREKNKFIEDFDKYLTDYRRRNPLPDSFIEEDEEEEGESDDDEDDEVERRSRRTGRRLTDEDVNHDHEDSETGAYSTKDPYIYITRQSGLLCFILVVYNKRVTYKSLEKAFHELYTKGDRNRALNFNRFSLGLKERSFNTAYRNMMRCLGIASEYDTRVTSPVEMFKIDKLFHALLRRDCWPVARQVVGNDCVRCSFGINQHAITIEDNELGGHQSHHRKRGWASAPHNWRA